ncbi:MAG: 50S ribosomal protein L6 [bacterium]
MSRLGKRPVEIPDSVTVDYKDRTLTAEGPRGKLSLEIPRDIGVKIDGDSIKVSRPGDQKRFKSMHGLIWSLVSNLIHGVSEGYEKTLLLSGLGYRVKKQANSLEIELGFSNPIKVDIPEKLEVDVPNNTTIKVSGADKQLVGQFAATVRQLRIPDPYNQKGIKYEGERIRKKVGKAVGGEGAMGA